MDLGHGKFRGQGNFFHQLVHGLAGVHSGDYGIVHIADRITHRDESLANFFLTDDRVLVAGDDLFGLEGDDLLQRADVFDRLSDFLAAHSEDVRELREVRAEEVSGEKYFLIG